MLFTTYGFWETKNPQHSKNIGVVLVRECSFVKLQFPQFLQLPSVAVTSTAGVSVDQFLPVAHKY